MTALRDTPAPAWYRRVAHVRAVGRYARLQSAARWRTGRGGAGVLGWVGFVIALLSFNAAARLGDTVRALADQSDSSTASVYATTWVHSWAVGTLADNVGAVVLGVLALAVVMALLAPTDRGVIPVEHASGWPGVRQARYVGSLVAQCMSLTAVVGLLLVTGAASLLTLDGQGRAATLVTVWTVWVWGLLLGPVISWGRELLIRAGRQKAGWIVLAVVGAGLAVVCVSDRTGAQHLFGFGAWLSGVGTTPLGLVTGIGAAGSATLLAAGWALCASALRHPEPVREPTTRRRRELAADARRAYRQVTWRTLARTRTLAHQALGMGVVGLLLSLAVHGTTASAAPVVVTIPVSVALTWQVNSLAMLSSSAGWVASRPGLARLTLPVHVTVGGCLIGAVGALAVLVDVVTGRLSGIHVLGTVAAFTVTAVWACAAAATLAIARPRRADVHDGHPLLPAATTIVYTLALMAGPGLVGAVLTVGPTWWSADGSADLTWTGFALPAAALAVVGVAWLAVVLRVWNRTPTLRARALLTVNQ